MTMTMICSTTTTEKNYFTSIPNFELNNIQSEISNFPLLN